MQYGPNIVYSYSLFIRSIVWKVDLETKESYE